MLKTREYRMKLGEVLKKIANHFEFAEIRGNDVASFIFAQKETRAIEIYQSENAIIIEFWENEQTQTEKEVDSYDKATKLVIDWVRS